ncbi:MAG: hypothetical protein ACFFAH_14375, partial [Promethearchaeota archaeon]
EIDIVLRSGLLSGLFTFIEKFYSKETIEFIESKNFIIAFKREEIMGHKSNELKQIVAYAILDKGKKLDKFISKNIIPFLKKVAKKFAKKYTGRNFSQVSQFINFKNYLNKVFEMESKSVENKFLSLII